jgi:hypothetical protein
MELVGEKLNKAISLFKGNYQNISITIEGTVEIIPKVVEGDEEQKIEKLAVSGDSVDIFCVNLFRAFHRYESFVKLNQIRININAMK